jgi:hypothetical protein
MVLTRIAASAEPVLSFYSSFLSSFFFLLLSTYGAPLAAPFLGPIEALRPSGIFTS